MKQTSNYALKMPEGSDTVNIDDLNYNSDVVDQKLKEVENKCSNIKIPVTSVNGKNGNVEIHPYDIKIDFNNSQLTLDIYLKKLYDMVNVIKIVNVSESEPNNAKEGDIWFDTNEKTIKVRINNSWIVFGAAYL